MPFSLSKEEKYTPIFVSIKIYTNFTKPDAQTLHSTDFSDFKNVSGWQITCSSKHLFFSNLQNYLFFLYTVELI